MPASTPDLIVVGASFAGAACAIAAAQRGLHVCVLERKHDPGGKLHTTGIIVKEAAEQTLLSRVPSNTTRRIDQVRLYAPNLTQVALAAPGYYFLTTDTPALMRWLAAEMCANGVDLRLGCAFTTCTRTAEGWQVDGIGRSRYLIGADGARSRVARHCGLGEVRQFLYGVEYEFPGAMLARPDALHCFISRRYAPGYIGWIAQNPTGIQAGLALRHDPARARVPDIDNFLLRVGWPEACRACSGRDPPAQGSFPAAARYSTLPATAPSWSATPPAWSRRSPPAASTRRGNTAGPWAAPSPHTCATAALRRSRWRSPRPRASASSAPCAGPTTACRSTGRSTC